MTDALTNTATTGSTTDQDERKLPEFKEIVTALIALAIVTTLIGLLWWGFIEGKDLEDNQKYIIGIALSLAGTVTGYYFGRVPAEKRAETAEKAEDAAKEGKAKAEGHVADAKQTIDNVLSGPPDSSPGSPTLKAQAASGDPVRLELEALRRRLG